MPVCELLDRAERSAAIWGATLATGREKVEVCHRARSPRQIAALWCSWHGLCPLQYRKGQAAFSGRKGRSRSVLAASGAAGILLPRRGCHATSLFSPFQRGTGLRFPLSGGVRRIPRWATPREQPAGDQRPKQPDEQGSRQGRRWVRPVARSLRTCNILARKRRLRPSVSRTAAP